MDYGGIRDEMTFWGIISRVWQCGRLLLFYLAFLGVHGTINECFKQIWNQAIITLNIISLLSPLFLNFDFTKLWDTWYALTDLWDSIHFLFHLYFFVLQSNNWSITVYHFFLPQSQVYFFASNLWNFHCYYYNFCL